MIRARFPLFVVTLMSLLASARVHGLTNSSPLRGGNLEVQTRRIQKSSNVVSASECENVRTQPFAARLELEYLYLVESVAPLQNLKGVQNVNNRAILDALATCDDKGFPLYALDLSTPHEDVEQGYCIAQDRDNVCSVIRGRAFIYLDGGITNARDLAYIAVDKALSDPTFVVLFEPNVVYSRFLRSVQENILFVAADESLKSDTVTADNESRSLTVKVAIAVSSVVFIVASIFALGFLRRQKQLNLRREQAEAQKKISKKSRLDRRRYFQSLGGDDGIVAGPVAQMSSEQDGRSFIWSDITSDSGSVTSILSLTTAGRLQKIDEEPDHERHAEVEASWDVQAPLSSQYATAYATHTSRLQDLVRKACSDERFDDVETTLQQISAPTTEASFPASFAGDEHVVPIEAHRTPPAFRSGNSANLSSLSDFHTPKSVTSRNGFSKEQEEHPPLGSFPSYESIWDIASASPTRLVNDDQHVWDDRQAGITLNRSVDTTDSDASLQRWLAQLLLELHLSQQMKRIEL